MSWAACSTRLEIYTRTQADRVEEHCWEVDMEEDWAGNIII